MRDNIIIFDAHEDMAWSALTFSRDYTKSAHDLRRREQESASIAPKVNDSATLGLPDWLQGHIALIAATLFVAPAKHWSGAWETIIYDTPAEAHAHAVRQINYYEELTDRSDRIDLVKTKADLDAVLHTWDDAAAPDARRVGIMLSMEGADPIVAPDQVEAWYARGVRAVGPAWTATRYAGGTGAPGPLTDLGHALLTAMAPLNMALDLSHIAEEAYYQAIERYEGPVLASHSNPRRFCPGDRGLSDAMIRLMAERDGVIGAVLFNAFLKPGWRMRQNRKDEVGIGDLIAAIDHICQVTGSARHVGIGSDLDGGFGHESIPAEFDTVADLWQIGDALRARGFAEDDVAAVMGDNFLRVYNAVLPD